MDDGRRVLTPWDACARCSPPGCSAAHPLPTAPLPTAAFSAFLRHSPSRSGWWVNKRAVVCAPASTITIQALPRLPPALHTAVTHALRALFCLRCTLPRAIPTYRCYPPRYHIQHYARAAVKRRAAYHWPRLCVTPFPFQPALPHLPILPATLLLLSADLGRMANS